MQDRLDGFRDALGKPVVINSGLRCPFWNRIWKGKNDSEHQSGEGVDIACATSRDRRLILKHALPLFDRIGIAKTFIHLGVSTTLDPQVVWLY